MEAINKKWVQEQAKQSAFGPLKIEQVFKKFNKKFKNEDYAMKAFEAVINEAMINATDLKFEADNYFVQNDPDKIRQRPFRIRGKLLDREDGKGNWKAEVYIITYDWENPGVEMTETLEMDTKKEIKKEALDVMQQFAKDMMQKITEGIGQPATLLNMKTGKPL